MGIEWKGKEKIECDRMKCLRRMCGVTIRYRIKNEEIRRRVGVLNDTELERICGERTGKVCMTREKRGKRQREAY